jgi:hypothetical protein
VLRRTSDAVKSIRDMMLSRRGHQWRSILQRFEEIRDELTAMDAVRSGMVRAKGRLAKACSTARLIF